MTTIELDDTERDALIELLTAEIKGTRYPLSPRLRPLRSILAKLGAGSMPPSAHPAPKPLAQPSAVHAKKRR